MEFNKLIERKGTNSIKWDKYPEQDIIGCGTADMDFKSSDKIQKALIKKAETGLYGYEYKSEQYYTSIINWNYKLYKWKVQKEWITNSPGIWSGIRIAIDTFSNCGDKILSHEPTFHPINSIIEKSGRISIKTNLKPINDKYEIDFEDFEIKLKQNIKIFILVNPHNPTGRVFTKNELIKIGDLCKKYNVLVLSDEVYGPLALDGHNHIPFSSINDFSNFSIILNAVSKPFNLQGLTHAIIIIPNRSLLFKYNNALTGYDFDFATNIFSLAAVEAAYSHGFTWLKELKIVLKKNIDYFKEFIEQYLPKIKVFEPEGLFMIWIDCKGLNIRHDQLEEIIVNKAKLSPTFGRVFGDKYRNFLRLNLGCSFARWKEILNRLKDGIESIDDNK